ncbi:carbonate dehydratase [Dimargaris cristalligena]|uniref:Carbonic anhydrase n=1 Tax=Dimargaris cristalligena TaxID=215637 RepID=A0A4Q0A1U9_9FUNG|nr:carbonate dehydratase [Dimargaris cristalligena]|eukprot:RKP39140.1 carbonate dehydratase [Dimargaris cristalligena]
MPLERILRQNQVWAASFKKKYPTLAARTAQGQAPTILWYGCSDSRASPEVVADCTLGDLFVQRNIANVVHRGDSSSMSVLEYAVRHLGVQHVVVCGHTKCGGVQAALAGQSRLIPRIPPPSPPSSTCSHGASEATSVDCREAERQRALIDLNVRQSLYEIAHSPVVQTRWEESKIPLTLHGWVYNLQTLELEDMTLEVNSREMANKMLTSYL